MTPQPAAPDDIDPMTARTVEEFAAVLRRLRARAGNPSYRQLEGWARRHRKRLPRSSVSDALAGRHLPRKDLILDFVRACGIDPATDPRWASAWARLAEPGTTQPADRQQLAHDIQVSGLRRIGATYLSELEWRDLFAGVDELDIFVAYGQTWRHMHARELDLVAARPNSRIRVFLSDPDDQASVTVLAARFAISTGELRTRIEATRHDYAELRRPGGADIQIYYWAGDRVFSGYRLDDIAVIGLYSHRRTRASAVPVFVCQQPGELYQFFLDELETVLATSRPARP